MAEFKKRKKKDGSTSYTASIRIKGYPALTATFKRLTDAKIWASDNESKMKRGKHIKEHEAKKHTLAETIDRYIINELPERKSDKKKFEMQLNWWKSNLGAYLLSDITPSLLAKFRDKLANEPSPRTKTKKVKRSNATINRYMASLSIVLTKATREWEWIEENPMFKVTKKKEARGRIRFLSDEERANLLKECENASNPLIYLIVVVALSTGARYSEIINLKWDNVDFKKRMFYFMDTKNGENRAVPISSKAHDLLLEHSKVRKLNSKLVFPRADGKKTTDIRWHWEEAIKRAKLEDFRFHDLRHSAASNLAMSGASLLEIAEVLGHKTMSMVKRYSHLTKKHTAAILESMNEKQFKSLEVQGGK